MMNQTGGWMSGWTGAEMCIGAVIGVVVVVLLVMTIWKRSTK
jgi:hypothetical protein